MNVKEIMELISYLQERYKDLISTRDIYANEIEDSKGRDDNISGYVEACEEKRSKASMEATQVDYFIKQLERIEVTR